MAERTVVSKAAWRVEWKVGSTAVPMADKMVGRMVETMVGE